jgi:protein YIPF1/2
VACLYGYSMACYVPALVICVLPLGVLQWLLLFYAFANSSFFLALSLRKHIAGLKAKFVVIFGVLGALQLTFFLCCKLVFVHLGAGD